MGIGIGIDGCGMVRPSTVGGAQHGLPKFGLDLDLCTFTSNMAKRTGPGGVFDGAPIVQGHLDSTGTGDEVEFGRGNQLANPVGAVYANYDPNQGTIVLWITPEWDGDDGLEHKIVDFGGSSDLILEKTASNNLTLLMGGESLGVDISAWNAGTTYFVVVRWDTKNTLDGTNYLCVSVDDVHTFGVTGAPAVQEPNATLNIGSGTIGDTAANGVVEGLTLYRRVLYDGTYGEGINFDASGLLDELAEIYNAGSGLDPCRVTGSWDVVFCLPTDSTTGALTTGTGEAWSHPHGSNELDQGMVWDGGYLSEPYGLFMSRSGANRIDCGSDASLDDLMVSGTVTIGMWFRQAEDTLTYERLLSKWSANVGWAILVNTGANLGIYATLSCATTNPVSYTEADDFSFDGKWHYITMFYDDKGDRKIYLAVDGRWVASYGTQIAGVGIVDSDAANNFYLGGEAGTTTVGGARGWIAIWSDDHHNHGTDFIPPRTAPTPGGNLVECWHLDEGTGATAAAQVNSPANDGTIAGGTWETEWTQEGTPVIPRSLEFDGSVSRVNCGSGATLDDLHSGTFTGEAWVRIDEEQPAVIAIKGAHGSTGWEIYYNTGGTFVFRVECATTDALASITDSALPDSEWHHLVWFFDNQGARQAYIALDGVWSAGSVAVGAVLSDAANNCMLGNRTVFFNIPLDGALGWVRLSDNDRHGAGNIFVPPARCNPPGVDGNTVEQWNFEDGAGTTLIAEVTSPGNDGTITMGNGQWNNFPDVDMDEPGARIFEQGYNIGSDGVGDGIGELTSLVTGTSYVLRPVVGYSNSRRARPRIEIHDVTAGAPIVQFDGPPLHGVHCGAGNSSELVVTGAFFPASLIGGTAYNIDDGSAATITGITGTNQNALLMGLSGGTDDDWDVGDEFMIVPKAGWSWAEPIVFTTAGNTSIDVRLLNLAGEGVVTLHQVELLESMLIGGDMESGAGNPWIPDGWVNNNLDPGDSQASTTGIGEIHSGNECVQFNVGASAEDFRQQITTVANGFYGSGLWMKILDDTPILGWYSNSANQLTPHNESANLLNYGDSDCWEHVPVVSRAITTTPWHLVRPLAGATVARFVDDAYSYPLDDVSLTITPTSEANSAESPGIRIDGRDALNQPVTSIRTNKGRIRWRWVPRHAAAQLATFNPGVVPLILYIWFDANNWVEVDVNAANSIRLWVSQNGVAGNGAWNCAGQIVAGTEYRMEARYRPGGVWQLLVDGVERITFTTGSDFSTVAGTAYWGGSAGVPPAQQVDAVYANP